MWAGWVPKPFWWEWLPVEWRSQIESEFEYWTPLFAWALCSIVIAACPWLYNAAMAWLTALAASWGSYEGPPDPEPPDPPYWREPWGQPPPRPYQPTSTEAAIIGDPTYFQIYGNDYRNIYVESVENHVAAISNLVRWFSRGIWGGPPNTIYQLSADITNGEGRLETLMDGCIVELTTVPPKLGGLSYGGDVLLVPRLGWLAFSQSGVYDERQKVEFLTGVHVPRNIARPDAVTVVCKPGTVGRVHGWKLGAGEP